jgi:hypothetical protein
VHGVEEISGQLSNCMFLGELGEAPDSLVDIFFLYQIFRDMIRIFQAGVTPKFGKAVLQGLNSTLHKKCHELITRQSTSLASFKSLDVRQKRKNLFYFCI